ncbi:MAG: sensor histidine kinase, partial [Leptothrix sp. (in: b-proteobacteria)]
LLGQTMQRLYPDEASYQATGASAQAALAADGHFRTQLPLQCKDGTTRWIDVNGVLLAGEPQESMWLLADMTAIQSANAEMARARDQAEEATQAKSAFLANMSHEIRTPMNAIIGLTHLMLRDTQDTQERERLGKIDGAAQHLLQVINDILDLSKIEAGKLVLEDTEFSLDTMLS